MKIKSYLQKLRLTLGGFILDKTTYTKSNQLKSVLFLRQDGKIGDYIVSSFVFRELKKFNPQIKIGVICTKNNAYLFQQNQHIDQIYLVKRKNIIDYIKQGRKIAKQQYDWVIDPTVLIRNRDLLLLRIIKAKNYIGYKKQNYKLFNHNIEGEMHFREIYCQALKTLGLRQINCQYDVPCDEKAMAEILQFLQKNNLQSFIAINFFGAGNKRRFSDKNIVKILDYLTTFKKNIVLLSYNEVYPKLRSIAQNYEQVFVHNTKTIFETIELIRNARLLISPDTSTVHIASGLNKPIIAFYSQGIENFTQWQPTSQGETHILFYTQNINEISPQQIKAEWIEN